MVEAATKSFEDSVDVVVPIRDKFRHLLPFNLKSRHGIAVVLSYFGDRYNVMQLMQYASHMTRAFFFNANGLIGFLIDDSVVNDLRRADEKNELVKVNRFQKVDLNVVLELLVRMPSKKEKLSYLSERYPAMCMFVMWKRGYKRLLA